MEGNSHTSAGEEKSSNIRTVDNGQEDPSSGQRRKAVGERYIMSRSERRSTLESDHLVKRASRSPLWMLAAVVTRREASVRCTGPIP